MSAPVDLAHSPSRNLLTITWSDGLVCEMPIDYLRAWCPCAQCQGHGTTTTFQPHPGVTATKLEEVGAYALSIVFSDRHNTGVYTWEWLRRLAPQSKPEGLKRGVYEGGDFRDA